MWTIGGIELVRKDISEKDPREEHTIHVLSRCKGYREI